MTILETFIAFAVGLPEERRARIEELLSEIMAAEAEGELSPEQLAELKQRMADPNPEYATDVSATIRIPRRNHTRRRPATDR